jgi:hypothetical protein
MEHKTIVHFWVYLAKYWKRKALIYCYFLLLNKFSVDLLLVFFDPDGEKHRKEER